MEDKIRSVDEILKEATPEVQEVLKRVLQLASRDGRGGSSISRDEVVRIVKEVVQ